MLRSKGNKLKRSSTILKFLFAKILHEDISELLIRWYRVELDFSKLYTFTNVVRQLHGYTPGYPRSYPHLYPKFTHTQGLGMGICHG